MASGIYQLTFNNGDTYVGKSLDLTRRWQQHLDKLEKGTAAKNMQQAYKNSYFEAPKAEVLLECHPDLLDEYENIFINQNNPTLNTQRPQPRPPVEREALWRHAEQGRAGYSVPVVLITLENYADRNSELVSELDGVRDTLESLEADYEELDRAWDNRTLQELRKTETFVTLEDNCGRLEKQLRDAEEFRLRVLQANWFQRLFGLWHLVSLQ